METATTPIPENLKVDLPMLKDWGDSEWRKDAACLGFDTSKFFPEAEFGKASAGVSRCKLICYSCPVRMDCLDFALRNNIKHGVWGGLSVVDRRKVSVGTAHTVSKIRIDTVMKHFSRAGVSNRPKALAKLAGVSEGEAIQMLQNPTNNYI